MSKKLYELQTYHTAFLFRGPQFIAKIEPDDYDDGGFAVLVPGSDPDGFSFGVYRSVVLQHLDLGNFTFNGEVLVLDNGVADPLREALKAEPMGPRALVLARHFEHLAAR